MPGLSFSHGSCPTFCQVFFVITQLLLQVSSLQQCVHAFEREELRLLHWLKDQPAVAHLLSQFAKDAAALTGSAHAAVVVPSFVLLNCELYSVRRRLNDMLSTLVSCLSSHVDASVRLQRLDAALSSTVYMCRALDEAACDPCACVAQ